MKISLVLLSFFCQLFHPLSGRSLEEQETITVKKTMDFQVTGDGRSDNWDTASWIEIAQRNNEQNSLETKIKVLYSKTGMYFLFECEDTRLDATIEEDYKHLWEEDVVEIFLWPDESTETYFEYELSPLDYELPLLIKNVGEEHHRWQPWYYEDNRRISHATSTTGGPKKSGAKIKSWTAEFFIPFSLLSTMNNIPPVSGTEWRANLYRVDYSDSQNIRWSWCEVESSFHQLKKYGTFKFE